MKCKSFFSVQFFVDGFGHDTATWRCFESRQSAENAIEKAIKEGKFEKGQLEIVEQKFNQNYIDIFD